MDQGASLEFKIGEKRSVRLKSLTLESTFQNFLMGHPESMSRQVRRNLEEWAKKQSRGTRGLQIIDWGQPCLPRWKCVADFNSFAGVNPNADYSCLKLCWFVDDIDRPVRRIVEDGLFAVDWDRFAVDGSYDSW